MIHSFEIRDFRGCKSLRVSKCAPVNVIVGDNGSGKTTILEALFLALCSNAEKAIVLRQYRGGETTFSNISPAALVEGLYAEFFYKMNTDIPARISIKGDGEEFRSLTISKGRGSVRIPKGAKTAAEAEIRSPIVFEYTDHKRKHHVSRVNASPKGIEIEPTGERLPTWFFFASQGGTSVRETATKFAELRRAGKHRGIVKVFTQTFPWIEDLVVDTVSGSSALSVVEKSTGTVVPIASASGGISRIAAILVAIATSPKGIVLVDEIENGLFYTKHEGICRAVLDFARAQECQLFMTTHSQEWLRALVSAADGEIDDVALWRVEKSNTGPSVKKFDGEEFRASVASGFEVRKDQG